MMEMMQEKKFNPRVPSCQKCHKTEEQIGKALRHCAKCKKTLYCSTECQRGHWKLHKKDCTLNAATVAEEKRRAGTGAEDSNGGQRQAGPAQGAADGGRVYIGARWNADLPDDFGMA